MSTAEVIENPAQTASAAAAAPANPFAALANIKPILSPELIERKAKDVLEQIDAFVVDSDLMYETAAEELLAIKKMHTGFENERLERATPLTAASNYVNGVYRVPKSYLESAETKLKQKMLDYQEAKEAAARKLREEAEAAAEQERQRLEEEARTLKANAEAEAAALQAQAEAAADSGDLAQAHAIQQQAQQVQESASANVAALENTAAVITAPAIVASAPRVSGISSRKKLKATVIDKVALIKHIAANIDKEGALGFLVSIDEKKLQGWVTTHGEKLDMPGVKVVEEKSLAAARGGKVAAPSFKPAQGAPVNQAATTNTSTADEAKPLDIPLQDFESSQFKKAGYSAEHRTLAMRFNEGGPLYQYPDTPPEEWEAFLASESKGSYFIRTWKKRAFNKFTNA